MKGILRPAPALIALVLLTGGANAREDPTQNPKVPDQGSEPQEVERPEDKPARWSEGVTVTAGRGAERLGDTASRVVVLAADDLRSTAALSLDDALRQVPGFTLFRRTGSRAANPTAQGASLRGIGPSGASRTLVLIDGIPLNDGFGGWVYWSRIPRVALERVELVEGGASDRYGSAALAGAIQAFVRQDNGASVEAAVGSPGEQQASLYAKGRRGSYGGRVTGEAFRTDGYRLIEAGRGATDTPAKSRHLSGSLRVDRQMERGALFIEGARFGESRGNGTRLQVNDTDWGQVSVGANLDRASFRAFYGTQTYHQTFSSVAGDRNSETLTRTQRVPSRDAGVALQWTLTSKRHALTLGGESRFVRGRSEETGFAAGRATTLADSGGRQSTLAVFMTDRLALGTRSVLSVGARIDRWSLTRASSLATPLATGVTTVTPYDHRARAAISPRASWLLRLNRGFRLTAAGYGAFRAPTLNELYRPFRVGDTQTLANANLTAERLRGFEAGVDWECGPLHTRVLAYRADVRDPVANVTLRSTPQLITRQRQNLGRTRSQGITWEIATAFRSVQLSAGYAFTDAKVVDFAAARDLEGRVVAQVPRHQWTAQARTEVRGFRASLQTRFGGKQFEDDQNSLTLDGYFVVDARVSRRIGRTLEAFISVENVTDSRYPVGLTPLETLSAPRAVRVGLRLDQAPTAKIAPRKE